MIGRCVILLLISAKAYTQTYTGTRHQAMGGTGTALQEIYSLVANPAGLTGLERVTVNVAHQYHFFSTEITSQTALLGIPTSLGTFGLVANWYGLESAYKETYAGFAYAKRFGPAFSAAASIGTYQLRVPNYGVHHAFSADMGLQYQLNSGLIVGFHYSNMGNIAYNHVYGDIPSRIRIGGSYRLGTVTVTSDAVYRIGQSVDSRMGIEYALAEPLLLRGGLSLNPFQQHTGFGVVWKRMLFDVAATFHPRLGMSPQIGVGYVF